MSVRRTCNPKAVEIGRKGASVQIGET